MLKYAKMWLQSLAAVVVMSGAAHAVPVTLNLSTPPTISNCQANVDGDIRNSACLATVAYAPSLIANPVLNLQLGAAPLQFNFLELTASANDPDFGDLFNLNAALTFLLPTVATFASTGFATEFETVFRNGQNANAGYVFRDGNLVWSPIASQQVPGVGLVSVEFRPAAGSVFGEGFFNPNPQRVILQARISVVPLPAGVLFLGSALLGLFALSRRRKTVAV